MKVTKDVFKKLANFEAFSAASDDVVEIDVPKGTWVIDPATGTYAQADEATKMTVILLFDADDGALLGVMRMPRIRMTYNSQEFFLRSRSRTERGLPEIARTAQAVFAFFAGHVWLRLCQFTGLIIR